MEQRGNGRRGGHLAVNFALGLGVLLVSLALAEAVVRVVLSGAEPDRGPAGLFRHDTLLGWSKVPGATVAVRTAEYSTTEEINSAGLRGPEYSLAKPAGEFRVLLLGDSFAEGYTVQLEDLCSEVLERDLADLAGGAIEVINAGTAGYSTDQELLYFMRDGVRYRPDVTVLLFYVNDVWFNGRVEYWRGSKPRFSLGVGGLALDGVPVPPPDSEAFPFAVQGGSGLVALIRRADAWAGARSALYRLARKAITDSSLLSGMLIRLGFAEVPGEFRPWYRGHDPELETAWAVTEELLVSLRDTSAAHGSAFVVMYVPARPAVYSADWRRTRRRYAMSDSLWSPQEDADVLQEICDRRVLACLVATGRFRREAERLAASGDRLYFREDGHWTPKGHALAGRLLAEFLVERGLIP